MAGWFCNDCHSLNGPRAGRCYSCGARRKAAEVTVLPLEARLPVRPAIERSMSDAGSTAVWTPSQPERAAGARPLGYRAGKLRAAAVVVLLALSFTVTAWILWAFGTDRANLQSILQLTAAPGAMRLLVWLGLARLALWILTPLCWFLWFDRVLRNVPELGLGFPDVGRLGAIGWWFVPIFWFWRPLRYVSQVYHSSAVRGTPGAWLPLGWWLAWIGSSIVPFVGQFVVAGMGVGTDATPARVLDAAIVVGLAGEVLEIGAGILAIGVVLAIQRAQAARASGTAAMANMHGPGGESPGTPPLPGFRPTKPDTVRAGGYDAIRAGSPTGASQPGLSFATGAVRRPTRGF
jgi:hypothetical protein